MQTEAVEPPVHDDAALRSRARYGTSPCLTGDAAEAGRPLPSWPWALDASCRDLETSNARSVSALTSASRTSTWPITTAPPTVAPKSNFGSILRSDFGGITREHSVIRRPRRCWSTCAPRSLRRPLRPLTPLERRWVALDAAVRQGKALYVGISSYSAVRTREAVTIRARRDTALIHQPSYSMFNRSDENGLLDVLGERASGASASPRWRPGAPDRGYPDPSGVAGRRMPLSATCRARMNLGRVRALAETAAMTGAEGLPAGAGLGPAATPASPRSSSGPARRPAGGERGGARQPELQRRDLKEIDVYAVDGSASICGGVRQRADRQPRGRGARAARASAMVTAMRSIVVSSGGAGYGFLVDEEGQPAPGGVRARHRVPHGTAVGQGAGAALYPLAYPAYDEETCPGARAAGHPRRRQHDDPAAGGGRPRRPVPATEILLVDPDCPLEVRLCFRAEDHGVLRQWVTVTNRQPGAVTLFEVAAASPLLATPSPAPDPLRRGRLGGRVDHDHRAAHARDQARRLARRRPAPPPVLPLLPARRRTGAPQETSGTVVAGALAWGGNTRFAFERTTAAHRAGLVRAQPGGGRVRARPRATFTTPEQIWAWSSEGVGPLSRRLHRWVRAHAVRDGDDAAPDRGQQLGGHLLLLRHRAAPRSHRPRRPDLGAELFLLDDGWFGTAHPRDDDTAGLGDWQVNEAKLPGWPRTASSSGPASVGSASGCGWSPRWSTPARRSTPSTPTGSSANRRGAGGSGASSSCSTSCSPPWRTSCSTSSIARWPRTRASAT